MATGMPPGAGTPAPGSTHNGMAFMNRFPLEATFQQHSQQMNCDQAMVVTPQQWEFMIRQQRMQQRSRAQTQGIPMGIPNAPGFNQAQLAQKKMGMGMRPQMQMNPNHPQMQSLQHQHNQQKIGRTAVGKRADRPGSARKPKSYTSALLDRNRLTEKPGNKGTSSTRLPEGNASGSRTSSVEEAPNKDAERGNLHYTVSRDCSKPEHVRRERQLSALLGCSKGTPRTSAQACRTSPAVEHSDDAVVSLSLDKFDVPLGGKILTSHTMNIQAKTKNVKKRLKEQKPVLQRHRIALETGIRRKEDAKTFETGRTRRVDRTLVPDKADVFLEHTHQIENALRMELQRLIDERKKYEPLFQQLQFDRDEAIRARALETGELRRMNNVLKDTIRDLERQLDARALSTRYSHVLSEAA
ncbi:uncharacterized protein PV07_04253 [Cladophialophora immunda]|uniref:BZIP domain-containing protein n=1 Tax=Cladophialophora immunda TaxID=569365 RepID=A0A0D2CRX4_9EURO|nr:uncharacterized protein PV07_04253 [Cladophialophora immunda]KIW32725.1 hypothetical protein PV07_04253 [Cladophialophora immunda]